MRPIGWCLALVGLCLASRAEASGFSVARFGGEHGHPTTENATAVYFNPAAIVLSERTHLFLDLDVAYRRLTYDRVAQPDDTPPPADARDANTGRARLSNWLAAPTLGATTRLGDFALGFLAYAPFGAPVSFDQRTSYDNDPRYPGIVDGVQRWHTIEGSFITAQASLAAAYRSGDWAFGLDLSLVHTELSEVRARADGTNDVATEGRSLVEASGNAFGFGVGTLWEAIPKALWFGLSYQSRPNVSGGMTLHGQSENLIGTKTHADVDVTYDLPDVFRIGGRYRPTPRYEFRLFGDYTRWSAFQAQCIVQSGRACEILPDGSQPNDGGVLQRLRRDNHDAFEVRAGMSYFATKSCEFFSGTGVLSSSVPEHTLEAGLPDFWGVTFALGARVRVSDAIALAGSYTHFLFVPRNVESDLSHDPLPTRQPDASGSYKQFVGLGNVNLDVRF